MVYYRTLNHEKQFILHFSPKCGSTSLKYWFKNTLPYKPKDLPPHLQPISLPADNDEDYGHYQKILFIRCPYARLVNFYGQFVIKKTGAWYFADRRKEYDLSDKSFSAFIDILGQLYRDNIEFQHHLIHQIYSIENTKFDLIYKVDELGLALTELNTKFHFPEPGIKHLNKSKYVDYGDRKVFDFKPEKLAGLDIPHSDAFYNPEIRSKVDSIYHQDLKLYRSAIGLSQN